MKAALGQIVDKRIAGVVYATAAHEPYVRLFLAFDDGTCFELYGSFTCCGGLDDARGIVRSVDAGGGTIERVFGDPKNDVPRSNAISTGPDRPEQPHFAPRLAATPHPPGRHQHRAWVAAAAAIAKAKGLGDHREGQGS